MCTLVIDLAPDRRYAVLVAAVRDEMLGRRWEPPAHHWPDRPDLLGGRDLAAGGTWLAVHPARRRLACLLNGIGRVASPARRRSRGELPLLAADGAAAPDDLTPYDPFHLVVADPSSIGVLSWDGVRRQGYRLGAGTHMFVNQGRWGGVADRSVPRAAHFGPRFAAGRPDPDAGNSATRAWAPWTALIDTPDVSPDDPRALVSRRAGGSWGTSSITLLGFGAQDRLRYDFRSGPGPASWATIRTDAKGAR